MGQARRQDSGSHRRQQRHRVGDRPAVRGRRGLCLHHRPSPGSVHKRCGDRLAGDGCARDVANLDDLDRLFARCAPRRGAWTCCSPMRGLARSPRSARLPRRNLELVFGVNVRGTLFTVQKGLPLMEAGGIISPARPRAPWDRRRSASTARPRPDPQFRPKLGAGPEGDRDFGSTCSRPAQPLRPASSTA